MSIQNQHNIDCPECGEVTQTTLWTSINVDINPELKQEVIDHKINIFTCSFCSSQNFVDISVLYHDMDKRYCIQYVSKSDMTSRNYYSHLHKDGSLDMGAITEYLPNTADYLFNPHYVFSTREMVAYIVFRDLCADYGRELQK